MDSSKGQFFALLDRNQEGWDESLSASACVSSFTSEETYPTRLIFGELKTTLSQQWTTIVLSKLVCCRWDIQQEIWADKCVKKPSSS